MGVAVCSGQVQPFYVQTRGISRRHRFKEYFHFSPPLSSLHTNLLTRSYSSCLFLRKNDANVCDILTWQWFLPSKKHLLRFLCLHLPPCIITYPIHFCHYHYVTFNFNIFSLFSTFFWINYLHSFLKQKWLTFSTRVSLVYTWGLFDRASSSWNKVKCQLDVTR